MRRLSVDGESPDQVVAVGGVARAGRIEPGRLRQHLRPHPLDVVLHRREFDPLLAIIHRHQHLPVHDRVEQVDVNLPDDTGLERYRVYWLAWLPTYPSNLFDVLDEHQVSVPLCETFRVYWDEIDEENPFQGLALKCLRNPFVGPGARRTDGLETIAAEYAIDGAILFATPSCRHSKSAHRLLRDRTTELGVPLLTLDMDISDPRGYSPEQIRTRVEEFVEILDQRRDSTAEAH